MLPATCRRFSILTISASSRPCFQAARNSPLSLSHRGFCDEKTPKWHARYPHKYFDFKAFRKALREKKENISEAELREVRRAYAPPPPEGWTVLEFLQRMKFGDGAEDVAELFEAWEDFISMTPKDIARLRDVTLEQRRQLARYVTLFCHGMWPNVSPAEYQKRFKGEELEHEGKPWTADDDSKLMELAELYDVTFGDAWIYLEWEMQRRTKDIRDRYVDLVVKPQDMSTRHEFAITKSSRPLLMNRKFRMMPPDLYIVPSEQNFSLLECESFEVPAGFREYRQADIF